MSNVKEEEKVESSNVQRATATTRTMTYVVKDTPPSTPDVLLRFEGLFWFVFHGADECEVGIHNTTHGVSSHPHQHDLDIVVWRIDRDCGTPRKDCSVIKRYHIVNAKTIAGIQIDVNRPRNNGVYVFQKDVGQGIHDNDWRWVMEFEKAPLYPDGIKLDEATIFPGISINHGLFYTLYKSTSEFELIPDDGTSRKRVGKVALMVGGNIHLQNDGDVTLVIRRKFPQGPLVYPLPWVRDKCYQIDVTNLCMKNGARCEPGDYGAKENDFYLTYDTFTKPIDAPVYALHRTVSNTPADLPPHVCFDRHADEHKRSSNDAPCGPMSAGGGGGG
ncbi:MAG TPA: hypothetical protein VGW58_20065 [Pyrinomonadaceae bacterium]|nr:hypothetical protein [Pyrinomonadaceae bacterium]